jgi:dTDP-4-dehydrorhamnose reductase
MRAIREVNPRARLVQTEDFGSIFSTPALRYQAEFENHRKWLSLDLLFGRVTPTHPLFRYLLAQGATRSLLAELSGQPCAPDLLGINYYVTSDRYLDEVVDNYPASSWGTNGKHVYVDVEAVRARPEGIVGHEQVLLSTWNRYRTPLALTEVHLGCSVDEQLRWLHDAWQAVLAARRRGVDVGAVTVWSLFGAYDWDSLVTRASGHYEPGVFDVRDGVPLATELAAWVQELARVGRCREPLLAIPGWWRRPQRLMCAPPPSKDSAPVWATPTLPMDSDL